MNYQEAHTDPPVKTPVNKRARRSVNEQLRAYHGHLMDHVESENGDFCERIFALASTRSAQQVN